MTVSKVVVVGLGFVGLPLALSFSRRTVMTYGLDVSEELIAELASGRSDLAEADGNQDVETILEKELASGRFTPTLDAEQAYAGADAVIITVGLPVHEGEPQETHLKKALAALVKELRPGMTVILRATVVPGTTRRLVKPLIEKAGFTVGKDVFLAYCPERLAEGRAFAETRTMPILIGAFDDSSAQRAAEIMGIVTEAEISQVGEPEMAELCKVVENAQRDVNIALAQEAARLCEVQGLSAHDLVRFANTHTRVNLLTPSAGVGGYCLPNAFHYLQPLAKDHDVALPTFAAARATNAAVPQHLAHIGLRHLERVGKPAGPVAVIGLAMKDNCSDTRLSPAMEIAETLRQTGARVRAYDPMVEALSYQVDSLESAVSGAALVYILVLQDAYVEKLRAGDWLSRLANGALVMDVKGVLAGRKDDLSAKGLHYWTI